VVVAPSVVLVLLVAVVVDVGAEVVAVDDNVT
jgi:hypothetical protein